MECPICEAPMTHLGYFSWTCDDCGHRCNGELPTRLTRQPVEDEARR